MPYNLTVDTDYNRSIVNHLANDRARQTGYFVPSNIQPNHLFNPARDGEDIRVRAIKMEGGSSALPTRRYLGSGKKGGSIKPIGEKINDLMVAFHSLQNRLITPMEFENVLERLTSAERRNPVVVEIIERFLRLMAEIDGYTPTNLDGSGKKGGKQDSKPPARVVKAARPPPEPPLITALRTRPINELPHLIQIAYQNRVRDRVIASALVSRRDRERVINELFHLNIPDFTIIANYMLELRQGGAISPQPYQPLIHDPNYIGMIEKSKVGGWNVLNGNSIIAGLGRKKGKKGGYYLNDTTKKGGWNLLNGNKITLI